MGNDPHTVTHAVNAVVWQGKLGELLVSLCYQPTAECITVIAARARELKAKDINGLSGTHVCPASLTPFATAAILTCNRTMMAAGNGSLRNTTECGQSCNVVLRGLI